MNELCRECYLACSAGYRVREPLQRLPHQVPVAKAVGTYDAPARSSQCGPATTARLTPARRLLATTTQEASSCGGAGLR